MTANIFVDPVIVATPTDESSREEVVAWLHNLELWLHEALSAPFLWLHALNITRQLEEHGRLPSFNTLRALARRYRLDINPTLLARDINTFFRDPERDLEEKLVELGYMETGEPVTIEPTQIMMRWPIFICPQMCNLLVTCAVCKHAVHPFANNLHIATLKLSDQSQAVSISSIIQVSISELACKPGDLISQTFPLLFTPEDLQPLIDVRTLWYEGENGAGIIYVIEQQWQKDWSQMGQRLTFRLGPHFMESIASAGLDTNDIILRKIVRVAAAVLAHQAKQIEGAKLHPLRQTNAGDSPQRIRSADQAKAWRLDITKHGAGWRLHYWHISNAHGESIEFSNICKESDHIIYE